MDMDFERDIRPITDFKRNTPAILRQLKKTGEPMVLTNKGKPEAVVMSPGTYRELTALRDRMETVAALRVALDEIDEGKGMALEEALVAFDEKHGLRDFQ
jgi:prevent-host-death family protein